MTVITNNTAASATAPAAASASTAAGKSMNQSDFLKLMTAQLQAQDPTSPVDNSQFVSQMAQFSQLSTSQDLLTSVNALNSSVAGAVQTSQILGSSNLVNRQVVVPSTTLNYSGSPVNGAVNVVTPGAVAVNVVDATGKTVRTLDLGAQSGGLARFSWDGKDTNGNPVAPGAYTMAATSGSSTLDTYAEGTVTAVGYGGSNLGTYLQVAGVGGVAFSQVAQIL